MENIWKIEIASNERNQKGRIKAIKRQTKEITTILEDDLKIISKNLKIKINSKEEEIRICLICISSMLILYKKKVNQSKLSFTA